MDAPLIVNVALSESLCPGLADQRFRLVRAAMRLCFHSVVAEIAVRQDGRAVAVVQIESDAALALMLDALNHIARTIGAPAIHVLLNDGRGLALGPMAEAHPFHLEMFTLPAVCKLAKAAA